MLTLLLSKPKPWIWLLRALVVIGVFSSIVYLLTGGHETLATYIEASALPLGVWLLITCSLYTLVLMVPFAPGLELGVLIMAIFGLPGILGAWLATVIGLSLAFVIGTLASDTYLISRIKQKLANSENDPNAIRWIKKRFAQFSYLSIALLLNVPGNVVLGGGGGIALSAGALGHLQLKKFIGLVALASGVLPILLIIGLLVGDRV